MRTACERGPSPSRSEDFSALWGKGVRPSTSHLREAIGLLYTFTSFRWTGEIFLKYPTGGSTHGSIPKHGSSELADAHSGLFQTGVVKWDETLAGESERQIGGFGTLSCVGGEIVLFGPRSPHLWETPV